MEGTVNMSPVEQSDAGSVTPARVPGLLTAATFILAGFAITFTQNLHEHLAYNRLVFALFGVITAAILLTTAVRFRGTRFRAQLILAGVLFLAAGVAAQLSATVAALSVVMTVWAAGLTVILLWAWARQRRSEIIMLALLAGILAVILASGARGLPAVMGFFGGYAMLTAVYLAIASVDTARASTTVPAEAPAQSGS